MEYWKGGGLRGARGFTLVEVVTVMVVLAVMFSMATGTFNGYLKRSAPKRAAEVFVQDLKLTRDAALRSRQVVVMEFDEPNLRYVVRSRSGDTLVQRFFHLEAGLVLSSMDLQLPGDTLAFDGRGIATLGSSDSALGRAVFMSGGSTYEVSFNSMGAARVDGP
jgi:prepilin-type N-terminal cleavage/methylation domain-containing protein